MKEKKFVDIDYIKKACEEKGVDFEEAMQAIARNEIPSHYIHEDGRIEQIHIIDIDENGDGTGVFLN